MNKVESLFKNIALFISSIIILIAGYAIYDKKQSARNENTTSVESDMPEDSSGSL